jgi:purine-binding chemotaxis protein CheW
MIWKFIGIQKINRVPEQPVYMKGIINLRGEIIPVIDVRLKFNKEPVAYDDRTCIIVVNIRKLPVGLIVDNVNEVLCIADNDIAPPPSGKTGFENRYVKGIGKSGNQVQLLLDCDKLLEENDLEELKLSIELFNHAEEGRIWAGIEI